MRIEQGVIWTELPSWKRSGRQFSATGPSFFLKTGLNSPLMREIPDKLDECERRLSELWIDSATDESEINSPIKPTQQEGSNE